MLCQLSTDKADEEKREAEGGQWTTQKKGIRGSEGGLQSVRLQKSREKHSKQRHGRHE